MPTITSPLCEFARRPLGLGTTCPRFSFAAAAAPGRQVSRFRIRVASDPTFLDEPLLDPALVDEIPDPTADLWDSGWRSFGEGPLIEYAGVPLNSRQRGWWTVSVADDHDEITSLDEPEWFELGLLHPEDWVAEWTGHAGSPAGGALYLRQPFQLDQPVLSARLYTTGLGWFRAVLNGTRVGRQELDPAPTNTSRRIPYCTFDVTSLLRQGGNVLGGIIGHGWYGAQKFLAQLELTLADGTTSVVCTGHAGIGTQSWSAYLGPIVEDSIYDGEYYDSRLEHPGWADEGEEFAPAPMRDLQAAMRVDVPSGELVAQTLEPIEVVESWQPVVITEVEPGVYVADAGRNLAGWVRLSAEGPSGTEITLRFAEVVGEDGRVNQENLRAARARDRLVLNGSGRQQWEPTFTYHGFRYVQIEGYPGELTSEDVEIRAVRSAVQRRAVFDCDDELITAIDQAVINTEASNLHGVPTDCPQRNERMGWLNDLAARSEELVYSFDTARLLPKWLDDIADSQDGNGAIADTAPYRFGTRPGDPVSMCYALIPWLMITHHGDVRAAETHFPRIRGWYDYLTSRSIDRIVQYSHYGDWAPPVAHGVDGESPLSAHTPGTLVSTAHYQQTAVLLSRMAAVLGRQAEAEELSADARAIAAAFDAEFWRGSAVGYGSGNQACNAIALHFGLAPEPRVPDTVAALVRAVGEADGHLTTGNLCTKYILETLVEHGHAEVAVDVVRQRTYPSWGFMIDNGATTIWERWENETGGGMNSHNHPMYASVGAWLHRRLAGIVVPDDAVGLSHVVVQPLFTRRLGRAASRITTLRGELSSAWQRTATGIELRLVVPVGTRATLVLPCEPDTVTLDDVRVAANASEYGDETRVDVSAGRHHVVIAA